MQNHSDKMKKSREKEQENHHSVFWGQNPKENKRNVWQHSFSTELRLQDQQKRCASSALVMQQGTVGSAQQCLHPTPTGLAFASVYLAYGWFLIPCHGFFKCANSCCSLLPADRWFMPLTAPEDENC